MHIVVKVPRDAPPPTNHRPAARTWWSSAPRCTAPSTALMASRNGFQSGQRWQSGGRPSAHWLAVDLPNRRPRRPANGGWRHEHERAGSGRGAAARCCPRCCCVALGGHGGGAVLFLRPWEGRRLRGTRRGRGEGGHGSKMMKEKRRGYVAIADNLAMAQRKGHTYWRKVTYSIHKTAIPTMYVHLNYSSLCPHGYSSCGFN